MVKFLKPNKAVIILQGQYAGRKAVIMKNYDDGTRDRAYGHCLVAGISKYPKKVIRKDSAKKTAKKSCVKAFVKVVNYSHVMPTRYTLDVDLKDITTADALQSRDKKLTAAKEIKSRFEDRFKTGKNRWFFSKLSVWRKEEDSKEEEEVTVGGLSRSFDSSIILVLPYPSQSTVKATFKCCCSKNPNSDEGFSVLPSDTPWDNGSIWSTMGSYFFGLHFPLSFGGLSVVAQIMHQPVLDPQLEAVSILLIQSIELWGALALLRFTAKSHFKLASFFPNDIHSNQRSWVQASALGFIILISVALFTSLLADRLIGPKVVNNTILKDILSSGSISEVAFFITYCFVIPLLEETVYRGFLLASLTSTMEWPQAVVISSCIFSLAHLSIENSLQLFIIGCVLACSYCWSGNLGSSLVLHSLYNALTLILTILS